LHPLTLAFVLFNRRLLVPVAILLFASRRAAGPDRWIVALFVPGAVAAVWRYATFRYRYDPTELVVRSGGVMRNERPIPYGRIQNIDAVQTLVHRALGVARVLVQTGSGGRPEAVLSVVSIEALEEMRARVFGDPARARGVAIPPGAVVPSVAASLPTSP